MSRKTVQALPCLLTCHVMVSSFLAMMAISWWPIVASVTANTMFRLLSPVFVSTIDQTTANAHAIVTMVLRQDAWNTVLSNTRHVSVIRENFVASTVANPCCCCCDFIYRLGAVATHLCCNFLDLESVLNDLGPPACSSSSKLSLPCTKHLCHLTQHYGPKLLRRTLT
jgi:hypothetical protein